PPCAGRGSRGVAGVDSSQAPGLQPGGSSFATSHGLSPDGDLRLQLDAEALLNAAADQVEEAEHVAGRGPGVDDDAAGVALADLGAADARLGQAGLLDQGGGVQPARVLEQPAGGLEAERLAGPAQDPRLAHPLDDGAGVVGLQLELGGQEDRVVEVAPALAELQLVALADLGVALGVEHLDAADAPADVAAAVAGVAA